MTGYGTEHGGGGWITMQRIKREVFGIYELPWGIREHFFRFWGQVPQSRMMCVYFERFLVVVAIVV